MLRAALIWLLVGMFAVPLWALSEELEESESSRQLSEARAALTAGDLDAAETLYRRVLLAHPLSVEAMMGWGRALGAQGRGEEAVSALRRRAEDAVSRDQFSKASELLNVAVEITAAGESAGRSRSSEIRSRLGQVLALDRRYRSAEQELVAAWESGQKDPATVLFLASTLWENGKLEEAEARFREAVALSTSSAQAASPHHQLGRFLLWRSRYSEAIEELDKAAKAGVDGLDFELDRAHALAGGVASGAATPAQVIDAFRGLVERAPEHSQLRYGLARALLADGRRQEAEEQLAEFRRLVAEDEEITRREGVARALLADVKLLLAHDQTGEALARLESMLDDTETLRLRALVLRRADRELEAAAELRKAIALDPDRQDLRTLLVEIERGSGSGL